MIEHKPPSSSTATKKSQFKGIRLRAVETDPSIFTPKFQFKNTFLQTLKSKVMKLQTLKLQAVKEVIERPILASNVQLAGEMKESGFKDRQWLIQVNGQFAQISELLYRVAEQANGEHTLEEIAASVTDVTEWIVSPEQIQQILQTKLIPMGVVASPNAPVGPAGAKPVPAQPRSMLRLAMRTRFIGPRTLHAITTVLQYLYAPPIFIPLVMLITAAHLWLYFVHGVADSIHNALYTSGILLVLLLVMLVSNVFHELGHASALRYGGGEVREVGMGFYLGYPAFYTDATDSYRLGRWARVRTDIGGFYFHLLFTLGLTGMYFLTKQEFLLAIVGLIDLDIIAECMPFVRLDGYWIIADLTGVPDFFSQMGPFLVSLFAKRLAKRGVSVANLPKLPPLKTWVKVVFLFYIVTTVVTLAYFIIFTAMHEPIIVSTAWDALLYQKALFENALLIGNIPDILLPPVQVLLLTLPVLANFYLFYRLGRGGIGIFQNIFKLMPNWTKFVLLGTVAATVVGTFLYLPHLPFTDQQSVPISVAPIDGITCDKGEHATEHIHIHLVIYAQDKQVSLPAGIGIPSGGNCLYWLHTHLTDGVIHLEAPASAPYTLSEFVDIWTQTMHTLVLTNSSFLGKPIQGHQLVIWVSDHSGQPAERYTGNLANLNLHPFQLITIAYDSPNAKPDLNFDWQKWGANGANLMHGSTKP